MSSLPATRAWYQNRAWLEEYGKVLVGFVEPPAREYGIEDFGCVILYEDGTKIDYTIMPVEIFARVVAEPQLRGGWDDGYQALAGAWGRIPLQFAHAQPVLFERQPALSASRCAPCPVTLPNRYS